MKRPLILLLLILILGAALVSCANEYDEVINVTEIRIVDDAIKSSETYGDYVVIHRNAETGRLEYKINYTVSPEDATDKTVRFTYDAQGAREKGITVTDDGLVSFADGGDGMFIKVFLVPADGSDVIASITIIALD